MVGKGPQPPAWTKLAAVGEKWRNSCGVLSGFVLFTIVGVSARMMEKD